MSMKYGLVIGHDLGSNMGEKRLCLWLDSNFCQIVIRRLFRLVLGCQTVSIESSFGACLVEF